MKKGFTIIELIIVISIISMLSLIGLSTYTSVQEDTRNAKRKVDMKEVQKALEIYKNENGSYPLTFVGSNLMWFGICTTSWYSGVVCGKDNGSSSAGAIGYIPGIVPDYMQLLPVDPRNNLPNSSSAFNECRINGNRNTYLYRSDGANFKLVAMCSPEGTLDIKDPFIDPCRPTRAWQVSSSSTVRGTLNAAGTGCDSTGW